MGRPRNVQGAADAMSGALGNKALRNLLVQLHAEVPQARTEHHLIELVRKAGRHGPKLAFDHSVHKAVTIILLAIALVQVFIIVVVFKGERPGSELLTLLLLSFPAFAIGAVVMQVLAWLDRRMMQDVTDAILRSDLMRDQGLKPLAIEGKALAESLKRFHDFDRGNNLREIMLMYEGPLLVPGLTTTQWKLYAFHYIHRTRKEAEHFYRYGVLLPFKESDVTLAPVASGTSPNQFQEQFRSAPAGFRHQTGSQAFDRCYTVHAADAETAERFLKPDVMLDLQQLPNQFELPSLEINDNELLIACSDKALLTPPIETGVGIQEPAALEAKIRGTSRSAQLERLKKTIGILARHSG